MTKKRNVSNFPTTLSFNTELILPKCSLQEGFLLCLIGQLHRIESSLLGCDQSCFTTGLCFSQHQAVSYQDLFRNLNIYTSILRLIGRKNTGFAQENNVCLIFLHFCRGIRSSGVTCFQQFHHRKLHVYRENQRHHLLIPFSLMFLRDSLLTSENVDQNKPWRHCVNNTHYNIPCSVK